MKPLILLSLLALAGCKEKCYPCWISYPSVTGYYFATVKIGQDTHCIPCSQAVSPEARFVCFGVTYTAKGN